MSQRLFRLADLIDQKYEIFSLGVKLRPKSKAQISREKAQLERLKEQKELDNPEAKKDALKKAKSDFINFVNIYLNTSDIVIENKYSPLSQGGRTGKNTIIRELYTFGSPEAKGIVKLLQELFPGDKPSGDLDDISLTVLSNRVNSLAKILTDDDTKKKWVALIRSRWHEDFMSEPKINMLNGLIQASKDLLPNIVSVLSLFSRGQEPTEPTPHEHIPTSPLLREKTNWRLGMHGVDEDTMEWIGITSEEDFEIANHVPEIIPVFEYVMKQTRQGDIHNRKFPKGGSYLKQLIQEYKENQKSKTETNVGALERPLAPPSPILQDFLEEQKPYTGPGNVGPVMRNMFSPEELKEIYENQKQREARERGEGSGEGSF